MKSQFDGDSCLPIYKTFLAIYNNSMSHPVCLELRISAHHHGDFMIVGSTCGLCFAAELGFYRKSPWRRNSTDENFVNFINIDPERIDILIASKACPMVCYGIIDIVRTNTQKQKHRSI